MSDEGKFEAHGFDPRQPRISPISVSVPEIIEWIERQKPRAIDRWDELGADEYGRSFTAARTMGSDIIADLHAGLVTSLRENEGESGYVKRILPVLRQKGWLPDATDEELGRRLRLIYDTNIRVSQAVGKWNSFQQTKRLIPYLRYSAVLDQRTRPSHSALHGIILPVEHPFWRAAFPPCGFLCRCIVTGLSRSQAARYGGPSTDQAADKALAAARALSRGPGDFFGYNPALLAEQAGAEQERRVNERRLPGSPPVVGSAGQGRALWAVQFGQRVGSLIRRLRNTDNRPD